MPNIKFLSIKQLDTTYKKYNDAAGFTDGKDIYYNFFYPNLLEEETIEQDLTYIFIHEFIHTIDMRVSEKRVYRLGRIIMRNLGIKYTF